MNLLIEPSPALRFREPGEGSAEVDLVHDGEHRDLKENGMKPRPADVNVDSAGTRRVSLHLNIFSLQVKETQEFNEVGLHEPEASEIRELVFGEVEPAEIVDLRIDLIHEGREVHSRRAALESVLHFRSRKLMQHALLHRELVEIRVEERLDNHALASVGCLYLILTV